MLSGGEYHAEHGSGALTVFARSRVTVSRCTFTGNWNGVDDDGTGSTYVDSIFWKNTLAGGISAGARYEIDIVDAAGVRGSFIHGDINDLRRHDRREGRTRSIRRIRGSMPQFVPQAPEYAKVGYRPVAKLPASLRASRRRRPTAVDGLHSSYFRLDWILLLLAPDEFILNGPATVCFFPDGHCTSIPSIDSAAPSPK